MLILQKPFQRIEEGNNFQIYFRNHHNPDANSWQKYYKKWKLQGNKSQDGRLVTNF